jgi:UDP-N-acetylenolpyruvoylglucosamine reductase
MMTSTESIGTKAIETLRGRLRGTLLQRDDKEYPEGCKAWNLNAHQHPALVVMAESAEDVLASVQFSRDTNTGVGVMATGHGVGTPCDGGLLINTSRMRGVKIDPASRTATVEAGALWKDVIPAAYAHGLAGLPGSAPHVGVVGYTLGGGFGYLGRKYGLNASGITAADIVTADGKRLRLSANEQTELFRALKGSVGNFGIVTSLTFRLYPITHVYGGAVFYPVENAPEALNLFARWTATLPDEVTAAFAFMNFPQLPLVPEVLRGKSVAIIRGCYCGEKPERGEALFRPVREELGKPIADTFGVIPVTAMDTITKDPVDPINSFQYGGMLRDLSPEAIKTFVKLAGAGSESPLIFVEFRQLGGALKNDQSINLLSKTTARFSMNAIGATLVPEAVEKLTAHLTRFAEETRPFLTGEVFVNLIEFNPSEDRVLSAYTPGDWELLVALKTKYDPLNIFRFNRNIPPRS